MEFRYLCDTKNKQQLGTMTTVLTAAAPPGTSTLAATRGDGQTGLDVTGAVASAIIRPEDVPRRLVVATDDYDDDLMKEVVASTTADYALEVRGEVVMHNAVFLLLQQRQQRQRQQDNNSGNNNNPDNKNRTKAPALSNARNAASGILLRKTTAPAVVPVLAETEEGSTAAASAAPPPELRFYAYHLELIPVNGTTTTTDAPAPPPPPLVDGVRMRRMLDTWLQQLWCCWGANQMKATLII